MTKAAGGERQDSERQDSDELGRFVALARATLDDLLDRQPELATMLGDHRVDDRLDDLSPAAVDDERRMLSARLADLDRLDLGALPAAERIDAEVLRGRLAERLFDLDDLREHEWNPLLGNPGSAIYTLLARDFAPLGDRLRSAAGRLAAVPAALETTRRTLDAADGGLPQVHLETAIDQFSGTVTLLATMLDQALDREPLLRSELEPPRATALQAIEEHLRWLRGRLDADTFRDPRLGPGLFAAKLAHRLDAAYGADDVLTLAESELAEIEERIQVTAARIAGERVGSPDVVRRVLDQLADTRPENDTVLPMCRAALLQTTEFVREQGLVTTYDDPVEIIVMPEIHRGVSVAYCDPPGPLEPVPLPTFFAVSPTPEAWPAERVTSFFREYNAHMLHNLTVHEAMPGHVLQLQHNARYRGSSSVRAAFWSDTFVEGWAVYAEELMVDRGYAGRDSNDALRLQQLKMQLRMTINAVLDARIHAHGMTEDEALRLMTGRGYQEEGEAVGKWRRALLTSAQLSTYFVGYSELRALVADVRRTRPAMTDREAHDSILAHGSPAPRHFRTLLQL